MVAVSSSSDRLHVALPRGDLALELLPAGGGELVEARALALVGEPPLALDEAALLEAVQGDVERSVRDVERAGRAVADDARDAVAVARPPRERLEHEHVERALENVDLGGRHVVP